MNGYFNFQEIKETLASRETDKGLSSHKVGNVKHAFPFTTIPGKSEVFNNERIEITGELVRKVINKKEPVIEDDGDYYYSKHPTVNKIIDKVEFSEDQHQDVLAGFLEDFLYENSREIKPLHLYLFNYIALSDKNKNDKKKYATFLFDLLFSQDREIKQVFSNKETSNLLTELIFHALPELEDQTKKGEETEERYSNVMEVIQRTFMEDFLYLSKHKDYFIRNFFVVIHYYVFQYVLQFLRKSMKFGRDENKGRIDPLHFTFSWETGIGGYRNSVEDYRTIKTNAKNLFVHIHCQSHLSHQYSNNEGKNELKLYSQILKELEQLDASEQTAEKEKLISWIKEYTEMAIKNKGLQEVSSDEEFDQLFKILFERLTIGMNEQACDKFGKNIDNLGKGHFLKARGKHGYILSLNQDHFLTLSAIAVKGKKISLKDYFKELENRGIVFDQYSQKEAVKVLDQLNYIEKKSDSGDAQYVKPIL